MRAGFRFDDVEVHPDDPRLLALPFVIAAVLYFVGWQPSRTGHHGHLHNPPPGLPHAGLRTADGQKFVEILAGLADGEQVLLNPLAK